MSHGRIRPRPALVALAILLAAGSVAARRDKPRAYTVTGEIRSVSPDGRKALVRHDAIPGYMMAMTMEFTVRDPAEVKGLAPGDAVRFRLVPTKEAHFIDRIELVARAKAPPPPPPSQSPAAPPAEARIGDELPDVELLDENGRRVRLSSFRGRALALTFIFTRCPLPDYCPRMGNHFARARELLRADRTLPDRWQLLSISFDAAHDTPEILRNYARALRGDAPDAWLFAAAPPEALATIAPRVDLMVRREGESFSHNLRTVVLDPRGRVHKQLDGNEWTPADLAAAIDSAVRVAPTAHP